MRMGIPVVARRRALAALLTAGLVAANAATVAADSLPGALPPASAPAGAPLSTEARVVVVEWKIKKGHEQEFLDYWSTKSTIPDRTGLIAEFLSGEESRQQFPWINWAAAEDGDATIYYNIGIWRRADDFMGQVGKYIDNNRPPLAFEADHRHRVFLAPLRWRIGQASLPAKDAEGVK